MKKLIVTVAAFACAILSGLSVCAQEKSTIGNGSTNLQLQYDFGKDRKIITTTLEGFYNDPWGNTFFFIDYDYNPQKGNTLGEEQANRPGGSYWEIARCFNFWQDTPLNFLSLQLEYNGGVYRSYPINHALLAGVDFFVHSKDFKNTFNFKLLYKKIWGNEGNVPLQFTFVWGMQDLFGLQGLRFCGFADVWGEKHLVYPDGDFTKKSEESGVVFIAEPQLWYCVGQHFGCPNLNIGGELELSYDFGSAKGFWCRPCLGAKWVF
ncbi:MAG: DUF5020 family protein [Bacteroidales bacterium]|nr:DUF5020 family protein [Bacteroidales bacterium]